MWNAWLHLVRRGLFLNYCQILTVRTAHQVREKLSPFFSSFSFQSGRHHPELAIAYYLV
jgi:hypothetical protein